MQKLSETIAATIFTEKNNETTRHLLKESQILAEQLRAQEEEMRQNKEELQATQEEMERKNTELLTIKNSMENEVSKKNEIIDQLLKEVLNK